MKLKELLEKITPIQWSWDGTLNGVDIYIHTGNINAPLAVVKGTKLGVVEASEPGVAASNAAYIAHAANHFPEVVEALRVATARLEQENGLLGVKPEAKWFLEYAKDARAAIALCEKEGI